LRRLVPAGALLGAALCMAGCSSREAPTPQPVVSVQVETLQPKSIQKQVTAEGVLYAIHQASIIPKVSAPIRKFYVNRGSRVHAGELLAELENRDLAAAVTENQGAYDQAEATYATSTQMDLPAQIQSAKSDLQNAEQAMKANQLVYESRQKLYKAGAIARNLLDQSQVTYIQSKNQFEIAQAHLKALQDVGKSQQLKSAAGQLTAAKGRYLAAKAQLGYSEIRSPIDGVVSDRPLYEGEMATAGSPLITVLDTSRVVARLHVSPQEAATLRVGDSASLSMGGGQDAIAGKVTLVSPAVDPDSTTVQVWVEAANPKGKLLVGSTVQVTVVAQAIMDAVVAPATSVLTADDGTTSVMVVGANDTAHQTTVETGVRQGDEIQIISGLKPGEKIVTVGAYGLPDGTKVKY
jgi:HlyD family secretion protein